MAIIDCTNLRHSVGISRDLQKIGKYEVPLNNPYSSDYTSAKWMVTFRLRKQIFGTWIRNSSSHWSIVSRHTVHFGQNNNALRHYQTKPRQLEAIVIEGVLNFLPFCQSLITQHIGNYPAIKTIFYIEVIISNVKIP